MGPEKLLISKEMNMILNSIADGVFTVDEDFVITSFNRAAHDITGVPLSRGKESRVARCFGPRSARGNAP